LRRVHDQQELQLPAKCSNVRDRENVRTDIGGVRTNDGARVGLALLFDLAQDHPVIGKRVKGIKAHASFPTKIGNGTKNAVMLQIGDQKVIPPFRDTRNRKIQSGGAIRGENDIFRLFDSEKIRKSLSHVKNGFRRSE
jgi:hypothetical protein